MGSNKLGGDGDREQYKSAGRSGVACQRGASQPERPLIVVEGKDDAPAGAALDSAEAVLKVKVETVIDKELASTLQRGGCKKYLTEGQFGKGSMEPKVKTVLNFLERGGRKALITNPDNMLRALSGEPGTHFEG